MSEEICYIRVLLNVETHVTFGREGSYFPMVDIQQIPTGNTQVLLSTNIAHLFCKNEKRKINMTQEIQNG
jgi:hypothetical protein